MAKAAGSEQATMYWPAASDTLGNVKLTPLVKASPCKRKRRGADVLQFDELEILGARRRIV